MRKNPRAMKREIQKKKRKERIRIAATVVILLAIVFASGLVINSLLHQPATAGSNSELKAAIIDQLSHASPNQTFIQKATAMVKQEGYKVDYYPSQNVTVQFYKYLPTLGYKLVIFRVYSGFIAGGGTSVFLYSSEPYSAQEYVLEQSTNQIALARLVEGGPEYFAINENFIKSSMNGTFNNAIVIMMGSSGLHYTAMPKALLQRGARACVGFNGSVTPAYMDQATTYLLKHFLTEKKTLRESLKTILTEIGKDPANDSLLVYYPQDAGNDTIQSIVGTQVSVGAVVNFKNQEFSETKKRHIFDF